MNRLLNILIHPLFLALALTLIILYFLPDYFEKYTLEVVKTETDINTQVYFHDLDQDGQTEHIRIGYNQHLEEFPFLICNKDYELSGERTFIDQINFDKPWVELVSAFFGDYNQDGMDEIYLFVYSNDSLFLLGIDPLMEKGKIFEKYIDGVSFKKGKPDFMLDNLGLMDLNGDQHKEAVFNVIGGFSVFPRALMAYDISKDTLYRSENDCAYTKPYSYASTSDGKFAFSSSSYSPENTKDSMFCSYSDLSSWLMVMDEEMKFMFPPVENRGHRTSVSSIPRVEENQFFIYAVFRNPQTQSYLIKYDQYGTEIGKKDIGKNVHPGLVEQKGKEKEKTLFIHFGKDKKLVEVSSDLSLGEEMDADSFFRSRYMADVDDDGVEEHIAFFPEQGKFYVARFDYSHVASIEIGSSTQYTRYSKCILGDGSANIFADMGDETFFFLYRQNPVYYFKHLVYLAIYIVLLGFFYLLLRIQKLTIRRKFEEQQKMLELELLTIKNQIDPHFTFNAINTLSAIVQDEDHKAAHAFLVDFSMLIRNTLKNSKNVSITLKDELDFVKNYLKLQQVRYEDKFEFHIISEDKLDWDMEVPKMIIQTFTENAVKHGLIHRESKGELTVQLIKQNSGLQIKITDNGIGRKASQKLKGRERFSTGKGHEIINQIISLYSRIKKLKVTYTITDLFDDREAAKGTRVDIWVPHD